MEGFYSGATAMRTAVGSETKKLCFPGSDTRFEGLLFSFNIPNGLEHVRRA